MKTDTAMKASLFKKDLTTRHTKAWANSQSLYYNTQSMRLISVFNIDV